MVQCAPRLDDRLLIALARLDDEREPLAEIWRRVGSRASELGVAKPSYAQVRRLLVELRADRRERRAALKAIGMALTSHAVTNPDDISDALDRLVEPPVVEILLARGQGSSPRSPGPR